MPGVVPERWEGEVTAACLPPGFNLSAPQICFLSPGSYIIQSHVRGLSPILCWSIKHACALAPSPLQPLAVLLKPTCEHTLSWWNVAADGPFTLGTKDCFLARQGLLFNLESDWESPHFLTDLDMRRKTAQEDSNHPSCCRVENDSLILALSEWKKTCVYCGRQNWHHKNVVLQLPVKAEPLVGDPPLLYVAQTIATIMQH